MQVEKNHNNLLKSSFLLLFSGILMSNHFYDLVSGTDDTSLVGANSFPSYEGSEISITSNNFNTVEENSDRTTFYSRITSSSAEFPEVENLGMNSALKSPSLVEETNSAFLGTEETEELTKSSDSLLGGHKDRAPRVVNSTPKKIESYYDSCDKQQVAASEGNSELETIERQYVYQEVKNFWKKKQKE